MNAIHTTVEYGHCMTNESFKDNGCKYRTFLKDYKISNKGTKDEQVYIDNDNKKLSKGIFSMVAPKQTKRKKIRGSHVNTLTN